MANLFEQNVGGHPVEFYDKFYQYIEYNEAKNGLRVFIDGADFRNNTAKPCTSNETEPYCTTNTGTIAVILFVDLLCVYMCVRTV